MARVTIYRLTGEDDDDTTSDKIIFNDVASRISKKDASVENAFCIEIIRFPTKGIADNQGVDQDLGDVQSVGNVEDVYQIEGIITKRSGNSDDGNNSFLQKLKSWDEEPAVNLSWREGRFGFIDEGDHSKDVIPVRTGTDQVGLIWQDITYKSSFGENLEKITIRLRRSRGDGT